MDTIGSVRLVVQWEAGLSKVKHLQVLTAAARSLSNSVRLSGTIGKKMSFIKVDATSDFSFHNLPYGIFSTVDNVSEVCLFLLGLQIDKTALFNDTCRGVLSSQTH